MAIRTIQMLGKSFGATPSMVVATFDGNQIFNGTVTTVDQPVWSLPNPELIPQQDLLFTFDVDTELNGQIPMTVTVSNGTVIFGSVLANYVGMINPAYTPEQLAQLADPTLTRAERDAIYQTVANPPLTAEELATLADPAVAQSVKNTIVQEHGAAVVVSSGPSGFRRIEPTDPRINPSIDGVAQNPDRTDSPGTWWWVISAGSSLAYDLEISPAVV